MKKLNCSKYTFSILLYFKIIQLYLLSFIFTDYFLKNKKLDNGWNIGAIELTELKEELERHSEIYKIEEVIIINASVKLIKLYCDGIPIDISFNQIGGICTLNYLEAIDEYIGRDHLFK